MDKLHAILKRLADARVAKPAQTFKQGANVVGTAYHVAHPSGPVIADLVAIGESAPELLAEIEKAHPELAPKVPAKGKAK